MIRNFNGRFRGRGRGPIGGAPCGVPPPCPPPPVVEAHAIGGSIDLSNAVVSSNGVCVRYVGNFTPDWQDPPVNATVLHYGIFNSFAGRFTTDFDVRVELPATANNDANGVQVEFILQQPAPYGEQEIDTLFFDLGADEDDENSTTDPSARLVPGPLIVQAKITGNQSDIRQMRIFDAELSISKNYEGGYNGYNGYY